MERITAVVRYLDNDETPRAQQLLAYFGEDLQTDAARSPQPLPLAGHDEDAAPATPLQSALALLADGGLHHPSEFHALPFPMDDINDALLRILDMGKATIIRGHFQLKSS